MSVSYFPKYCSSVHFGGSERNNISDTKQVKKIKTIHIDSPDETKDIELIVGTAYRLTYVDVLIEDKPIVTHAPVEANGTLLVTFSPRNMNGMVLLKVIQSGTTKVIASEEVILQIAK